MADGKPTLHHMNVRLALKSYFWALLDHLQNSQSQRILWLMEELEIPYSLDLNFRVESGAQKHRAPTKLKENHAMGKAPQLTTAEGRVIAESSAIAAYLIATYDKAKKFQGDGAKNDWIRDESLSSFANASFGPIESIKLFLDILTSQMPFFLRPLVATFTGAIHRMFVGPEFKNMLTYLQNELGNQEYFMGKEPGRADFMMEFPLAMIAHRKWADLSEYPGLMGCKERVEGREAWKRSLTKGNGYDLSIF